jgi:glutamyl-tRNA synthetase
MKVDSVMPQIVTRFAPSPTGYLHVGGARTALFNWLLARHTGGKFLLRIEDTDTERSTAEATRQLLEDLRWLGLQWDNADLVYQSKRLPVYDRLIEDLLARGLAYKAYETPEELTAQRALAEKAKRAFIYRRPTLTDAQIAAYEAQGRVPAIRFVMPVKDYRFDDAVLGPNQGVAASQVQDFIIRRSDGMPTYHFAVVVDDNEMGVTHVLRGQEHLLNTVNHIALQEALGYPRPIYAHLPVILAQETGEKLSKRDRDRKIRQRAHEWIKRTKSTPAALAAQAGLPDARVAEWLASDKKQLDLGEQPLVMSVIGLKESDLPEIMVYDFRKSGYLPEVLNNFLALLGFSPGDNREHLSMDELVSLFSLDKIGASNARFNREKLVSFNTDACAAASPARLLAGFKDFLAVNADSPLRQASDEALAQILRMKVGFRTFREVEEKSRFLFLPDEAIAFEPPSVEKVLRKNNGAGLSALRGIESVLKDVPDFSAATLESAIQRYCDEKQLQLGGVAQPLRVAISGGTVSPPIFQSLEFLGKERALVRIARCLEMTAPATA